ncbi:transcription antitermination factor NusB [Persicobacter sp. CCB-QB2]|uniref:transcription antitermination factor NusB n=1 Tax=Persicobacter sp. CCB-QB2 TaxID=1561025 RepID=UPI00092E71FB|nr:transcription antitermination factor NusB [Persicobacter sp. CCB-QB2]
MLNRRSLRIKTLQALYGLHQSKRANFGLAQSLIDETFAPDLNSMEPQDPTELRGKARIAKKIFRTQYNAPVINAKEDVTPEIIEAVKEAIKLYNVENQADLKHYRQGMLDEAENVSRTYIRLLELIVAFGDLVKEEVEEMNINRSRVGEVTSKAAMNFYHNPIVTMIRENEDINFRSQRLGAGIDDAMEVQARDWYRKLIKKDPEYREYTRKENPTFEEHKEWLMYFVKNMLFKHPVMVSYFEEQDLQFSENRSVLRSMVLKTIKSVNDITDKLIISELSMNWEEDKRFFNDLFLKVVENENDYVDLISNRAQNWDKDRINVMDMLILKMALAEMINFPSIPVKVTINEAVELAKNYSTLKSKKFVNGILDVLAISLGHDGTIRKSGRGLIDNK